jgi:transposase
MEQRAVVRFLTFKMLSARDIMAELEGIYGHEALSGSMVRKWLKRFVNGKITLEDDPWSERPRQSNLSESLRVLIKETVFISCKCMHQNLRIPKTTCLRVLHEDLGFNECYLK